MSDDGIQKPFTLAARHNAQPGDRTPEHLRDKDNADPKLKPNFAQYPAPNLAPPGMSGIKTKAQREFKPLVPPDKDKGHNRER